MLLAVDKAVLGGIVYHLNVYLDFAALARKILGLYFFAVKVEFKLHGDGQLSVGSAAVIKVGVGHIPTQFLAVGDGSYLALDVGYIFKVAHIVDIDLVFIGMEPVADADLADIAVCLEVDIDRLGLGNAAGGGIVARLDIFILPVVCSGRIVALT